MAWLLALVHSRVVDVVIIATLDRLTRSVADLAELLERFKMYKASLVSVAGSLDTRSAAGRWPERCDLRRAVGSAKRSANARGTPRI